MRAPTTSNQRSSSTTDKVLSILDWFTEQKPVWTADVLMDRMDVGRATMYRYLRALVSSGLLTPDGAGAYSLGPRCIEMDRQIRVADPLLLVAPQVMQQVHEQFHGAQLLCRYYGLNVLSAYSSQTDDRIKSSFDRGRPFSMFRGAPSRIILANLTTPHLQRLFLEHSLEIASAGLGNNWLEFRENMRRVRKLGYVIASDIDKSLVGISAPIFLPSGEVTASLCLVKLRNEVVESELAALGVTAVNAAAEITHRLQKPRVLAAPGAAAAKATSTSSPARGSGQAAKKSTRPRRSTRKSAPQS